MTRAPDTLASVLKTEPDWTALPILEGVAPNAINGAAQFAVSSSGTLVYVPGQGVAPSAPLQWMIRDGSTSSLRATPANWRDLHFAPDGNRIAMSIDDGKQADVFVYDWARDTLSRLTFDSSGVSLNHRRRTISAPVGSFRPSPRASASPAPR